MKTICALVCLATLLIVLEAAPQLKKGRFDHIDVDAIFKNERVTTNYIRCILDKGPCTAEGRDLKATIPNALSTQCTDCSHTEKEHVRKASKFLINNRPDDWKAIQLKYDPNGEKIEEFKKFIEAND